MRAGRAARRSIAAAVAVLALAGCATAPSTAVESDATTTEPTKAVGGSDDTTTSTVPVIADVSAAGLDDAVPSLEMLTDVRLGPDVIPQFVVPDGPVLATLREGDSGAEVSELQLQLNRVSGAGLMTDGVYGPATTAAVLAFQAFAWLPETGEADHATRSLLAATAAELPTILSTAPAPRVGDGTLAGCQVAVIGDSLMAGAPAMHVDALARYGCAADVDGLGGRSLAWGWQCRITRDDGSRGLRLVDAPIPGNDTCAPSGLELLHHWAANGGLGDLVVIALGTNDAGIFSPSSWTRNWTDAMRIAGGRRVVFLTTRARPGHSKAPVQDAYSEALRNWCPTVANCFIADWAMTATANDTASYVDDVHLTRQATEARAEFIANAAATVLTTTAPGPTLPPPVTVATVPAATTSTTTTSTLPVTTTTSSTTTTTSTTTSTTSTTTSTTTTTTVPATTVAPAASSSTTTP